MDESKLRELQEKYIKGHGSDKRRLWKIETLRREFVDNFPIEKIPDMKLEDYVFGLRSNDGNINTHSFCNWIENITEPLGEMFIGGSGAFCVFYEIEDDGIKVESYMIREGRTSRPVTLELAREKFQEVKAYLYRILKLAEVNNIDELKDVYEEFPMNDHVKAKILYLYFPDKFLNVFSSDWLKRYTDILSLSFNGNSFEDRMTLLDFKKKDNVMSKWSTQQFAEFLWESFPSSPVEKEIDGYGLKIRKVSRELTGIFVEMESLYAKKKHLEKYLSIGIGDVKSAGDMLNDVNARIEGIKDLKQQKERQISELKLKVNEQRRRLGYTEQGLNYD